MISVINFLAAHLEESFTVSELSERLSMSFGSTHRVLTTLTQAGYLSRHPKHKTYTLGLALLAIGQVAMTKHKVVAIAQEELQKVATELQVSCIVSAITDKDILYLATAGNTVMDQSSTRIGDRRPFVPPLGLCHVAWASPKSRADYLKDSNIILSKKMQDYVELACETIRERGYSMGGMGNGTRALRNLMSEHVDSYQSSQYWEALGNAINTLSEQEIQILTPSQADPTNVTHISVPVFSPTGEVILELTLRGTPSNASAKELEAIAIELADVASYVTTRTFGRKPSALIS